MSFHCTFNSYYAVHQYNADHWNMKYQWEIITKQHAFQHDSSSCGVHVMKVCWFSYIDLSYVAIWQYAYLYNAVWGVLHHQQGEQYDDSSYRCTACREEMTIKLLINSS